MSSINISKEILDNMCPDFKPGKLSAYRSSATFCWKQLKVKLFSEEGLETCQQLWKSMEKVVNIKKC